MKFLRQLTVILAVSFAAELMEYLIPLPIAASMYGLVLMLAGLMTKIIPLEKVEGAADFLVEIMPVLFVPPTVSLIANVDALRQMLVPLLVICVLTTALIMGVTGRTVQGIMRCGARSKAAEGRPEYAAPMIDKGTDAPLAGQAAELAEEVVCDASGSNSCGQPTEEAVCKAADSGSCGQSSETDGGCGHE